MGEVVKELEMEVPHGRAVFEDADEIARRAGLFHVESWNPLPSVLIPGGRLSLLRREGNREPASRSRKVRSSFSRMMKEDGGRGAENRDRLEEDLLRR